MHSWSDGTAEDEVRLNGSGDDSGNVDAAAYANAGTLGASPMGARVNAELRHDPRYYGTSSTGREQRRSGARHLGALRALWGDVEDEEDS